MDAAERQALFAEIEQMASDTPAPVVLDADMSDVPVRMRWRDVCLGAFGVFSVFCIGAVILGRVERWFRHDLPSNAPDRGFELFGLLIPWASLVLPALTLVGWFVYARFLSSMISRVPVRRPLPQRVAALIVNMGPARSRWTRRGDHQVVLEDRSGDQTLYHANETLARDLRAGVAGLAIVAHHKLLAFQPLDA